MSEKLEQKDKVTENHGKMKREKNGYGCVECLHLNSIVRANVATRNKGIEKKIGNIENIVNGSEKLYQKG